MANVHTLKTLQPYFDNVLSGRKRFELRKNDRDFQVGDSLILAEWVWLDGFTGRRIHAVITYITDFTDALRPGYVAMGIELEQAKAEREAKP